jgi:hypothetical protein
VIISGNDPDDITYAHCYYGSPINKPLHGLCKPSSPEAFTHAIRLPKFPAKNFPGAHAVVDLPGASALSSSPPQSLRTIVPNHGRGPYAPPSFPETSRCLHRQCRHHPQGRDAIPELATMLSSPSPRRCAPHVIPKLVTLTTCAVPRAVAPSSSLNPRRPEPAMPLNPCYP